MGKLKFTLSNILLWVSIIATCLILENVGFLTIHPKDSLSDPHFFMLFTVALGGYISYFLIEHIKNKVSIDYMLGGIMMFLFIGGAIAIWAFQGVDIQGLKHYVYNVTYWDKTIQTLSLLVYILALYSILFYFNKNHPSIRKLQVVFGFIIAVCYVASIYSWIAEYNNIIHNLTKIKKFATVESFFWNPNMFSIVLALGLFSCFGLNYFKKNVFSYISIALLMFMICIVGSLTGISVCFASILLYFLIEIIFTIRKHHKRGLVLLIVYMSIVGAGFIIFTCALNYDMGNLSLYFRTIYENFHGAHYDDLSARTVTWKLSCQYISENPMQLMFGFGFRNANYVIGGLLYAYRGWSQNWLSAHSGYVQTLMNFGLIGVIAYILFLAYYFYCFIRLLKKDVRFAVIFLVIGLALLGYAVMESVILFNNSATSLIIGVFFYLPMVNMWKHHKHRNLGDDVIEVKKPKPMPSSSISKPLAKLFMALLALTLSFLVFPTTREHNRLIYLIINLSVLIVMCGLTVPYIIASISKNHSRKAAAWLSTLNFLIVASPMVYLGLRYYLNFGPFASGAEWLIPVFIAMILVGECLIFGVAKGMKFRKYKDVLVGLTKNSFMGLFGVGIMILVTYFVMDYLDLLSPLTYLIYPVIILLSFYLFSYMVPFKDQSRYLSHYNESLLYSIKMDVLKDRLGEYNEKRRD